MTDNYSPEEHQKTVVLALKRIIATKAISRTWQAVTTIPNPNFRLIPAISNDVMDFVYGYSDQIDPVKVDHYKINLAFANDFLVDVLSIIMKACEIDAEFCSSFTCIKYRLLDDLKEERDSMVPNMVVYTKLSKKSAQVAISKFEQLFGSRDDMWSGITPKFNLRVGTGPLFYAGGDRDDKNTIQKRYSATNMIAQIWQSAENFALFIGQSRLHTNLDQTF